MVKLLGWLAIVGVAHVALGVFLYSARTRNVAWMLDSDLLVFVMPALAAFGGYVFAAWRNTPETCRLRVRFGIVTLISLVAVVLSCFCTAMVAFQVFGT
jgi:hypothetical protein